MSDSAIPEKLFDFAKQCFVAYFSAVKNPVAA
jgi:hypothetical protein